MTVLGTTTDDCVKVNGVHYWTTGKEGRFHGPHGGHPYREYADDGGTVIRLDTAGNVWKPLPGVRRYPASRRPAGFRAYRTWEMQQ